MKPASAVSLAKMHTLAFCIMSAWPQIRWVQRGRSAENKGGRARQAGRQAGGEGGTLTNFSSKSRYFQADHYPDSIRGLHIHMLGAN